jgi:hypothetical protein
VGKLNGAFPFSRDEGVAHNFCYEASQLHDMQLQGFGKGGFYRPVLQNPTYEPAASVAKPTLVMSSWRRMSKTLIIFW